MLPEAPPAASDVEQPLLHDGDQKEQQDEINGIAAAAVKELRGKHGEHELADIPEGGASVEGGEEGTPAARQGWAQRWWCSTVPATLAAVLCLWALKLVQQGYVDGAHCSSRHTRTPACLLHACMCHLGKQPHASTHAAS
jgi:hypothetical protein